MMQIPTVKIIPFLVMAFGLLSACAPVTPVPLTGSPPATGSPPSIPSPEGTSLPPGTSPVESATPGSVDLHPFGTISIGPDEIAFNNQGDGQNVDSIAFWEADDPAQSLMVVTSKGNAYIEVYRYPFLSQAVTLSCGQASNGVWVDQERDLLYITERNSSNLCAYDLPSLDPAPSLSFTTPATGGDSEPNLTMLSLSGGQKRIYVSYDDIVFFHDAITGEPLGQFRPTKGLETMYGDDYYQVLYIPDENDRSGVYLYDPDGNPAGETFGDRSIFQADAEGIAVYPCLGSGGQDRGLGLIVVSDQKDNLTDFEVFDRQSKAYLGTLNVDGVNNTDGIAITRQASPGYPLGLLAVIDDDSSTVGVSWDAIFAKTGLSCGTTR